MAEKAAEKSAYEENQPICRKLYQWKYKALKKKEREEAWQRNENENIEKCGNERKAKPENEKYNPIHRNENTKNNVKGNQMKYQ